MSAIITADNITWRANGHDILRDISLSLDPGEILGVIGPNGAGKSSLLRVLANIEPPARGRLALYGTSYARLPVREFAARVGYLEQHAQVHWPLLVSKVIELGRLPYQGVFGALDAADREAIARAESITGIAHLRDRVVTSLSEGEKMLVALTRLLATRPEIAIADEPVAALDPYHQLLIMETFRDLVARRTSFSAIIVLHDLTLAAQFCDRLILLTNGAIAAEGAPETVLSQENLRRHYRINADILPGSNGRRIIPVSRYEKQERHRGTP